MLSDGLDSAMPGSIMDLNKGSGIAGCDMGGS